MRFLIGILFLSMALHGTAQKVMSKDGMELGERQSLIEACMKGGEQQTVQGVTMSMAEFCACICDELMPNLNSWELLEATQTNSMETLMLKPDNLELLLACAEDKFSVHDDYRFGSDKIDEFQWAVAKANCVRECMRDPEVRDLINEEQADRYCDCALGKLIEKGFTYKELMEIEDTDSEAFMEVALPCLLGVFEGGDEVPESIYDPADIRGRKPSVKVPLTEVPGLGFKLKLDIGGFTRYYVLDTGASDLIIDDVLEEKLLDAGVITEENYWGIVEYNLANNETVPARVYIVDNITIGGYQVNNVVMACMDGGSLLCGKGFLDKFSRWELHKKDKVLVVYR